MIGVVVVVVEVGVVVGVTRWVNMLKDKDGELVAKSRLVVRGFEDVHKDLMPLASLTCTKTMWRFVLCMVVAKKWILSCIDITNAFLQRKPLERQVYIKLPKDRDPDGGKLWRPYKGVYGLGNAPRTW